MPSNSIQYQRDNYEKYWWSKKTMKKRVERNKARRHMIKAWKARVWDWKAVDHIKPLSSWWKTTPWNLRIISPKLNWSLWAKIATRIKNKKKWKN